MGINRKVRIGWAVLLSDGPVQFIRKLLRNFMSVFRQSPSVDECDIVYRALKPSNRAGLMIDVGAHYGSALDGFARDKWRIIAFEPDIDNRDKLSRVYGSFSNVSIDPRGISDQEDDHVPFYSSSESSGISGLLAFDRSHQSDGTISVTTLAHVISEYGVDKIDFLKVDTEGLDLLVIRGLPDSASPTVVVCEFEDRKTKSLGYTYSDLAEELERRGYIVIMSEWYPIEGYGQSHRWRRAVEWPAKILDQSGWGNFIAVSDRELADRILHAFPNTH